ncbi:MAG: hypothetical protein H0X44_01660 [Acidobacteria bacterium]|nr:hypothetical protein [Acidobacteriota bacterium]
MIQQAGIQASGNASFSSTNYPGLGAVSGTGAVLGVLFVGGFRFSEIYEGLDIPSRPSPNHCYVETDGLLTIRGSTMTGSVTETVGCAGVQVGKVTREIEMQRR